MSRQRPGTAAGAARTEWIDHWPTIDDVLNDMGHPVSGTGRQWTKAKCPFHGDTHASASINRDLNLFYCFACDISTTALGLIMRSDNVDTTGAKRIAEERFGTGGGRGANEPAPGNALPFRTRNNGTSSKKVSTGRTRTRPTEL